MITAMVFYRLRQDIYHRVTSFLPLCANKFTNAYLEPYSSTTLLSVGLTLYSSNGTKPLVLIHELAHGVLALKPLHQ